MHFHIRLWLGNDWGDYVERLWLTLWVQGHLKRTDINSEHLIFHWKALATTNEITPNVVLGQENPNESPLESANQNQLNQESLSNPNSSIENSPTQTKTEPVDDESARRNQGKIKVHEIYTFDEEVAFLGSFDVGDGFLRWNILVRSLSCWWQI